MSIKIQTKIFICLILISLICNIFCMTSSYALDDIFSSGREFLQQGKDIDETIDTTALNETSDYIYRTLLAIAIIVAVIIAMILGIQFMAASADEKAKVKEAILPFVVGCIVVFGAFTIWKIAVNIGNDAEKTQQSAGAAAGAAAGVGAGAAGSAAGAVLGPSSGPSHSI